MLHYVAICGNIQTTKIILMKGRGKMKRFNNGWSIKIGAFRLRYFTNKGFRLYVNFSRHFFIKLFGFNQKIVGV